MAGFAFIYLGSIDLTRSRNERKSKYKSESKTNLQLAVCMYEFN